MLANDLIIKKLKNKELHGLLCNKLSKRVDRFAIERLVLEWIKRLTKLLFN